MSIKNISLPQPVAQRFSPHLEAIRGFAALLVVWHHAVSFPRTLDPHYTVQGFWAYMAPSHFSVLLFFVLSGYVIGLTNPRPLTTTTIPQYLRKRLVRIYPIYAVCMLLAVLVGWGQGYSWATVIGNFTFLQIAVTPIIHENSPAWSLHFEVLYYLLFVPVSFFRLPALLVLGVSLAIGIGSLLVQPAHPLLASYGLGFTFWMAGLTLAHYADTLPTKQPTYQLLLAFLLLFASFRGFDAPETMLRMVANSLIGTRLEQAHGHSYASMLAFRDLAWLPYAVLGIMVFAHKSFRFQRRLLSLAFLLPAFTFWHIAETWPAVDWATFGLGSLFYLLAVICFFVRIPPLEPWARHCISGLGKVGGISYGLYIVHFPLLQLMARLDFFAGSALTFWTRFVVLLIVALLAAYGLEKKFQPWVRTRWA
ncbi:acyltransferase family protein [Hymenobacter chitinivorans]|uniref:Peptidoglycan/LPS O-acetylase OafA/YrhL n=1 Tax=Hymenobacter chitinivorans DSM 11115 TaxID=1121954 RepID=A0A2M9BM24_9BACT|nr:acyltransferase [Hymenobacter chitinivorans]PJJ58982.1 peptidoglycan/LPS O-acetylase OafA/YrhL [Hymenobacter chitinivorans DSM 11115]